MCPTGRAPPPDTPAPPRFLYDFENLLLSYADRSRMAPAEVVRGIPTGTNEPFSTFTLDGFVAGTWKLIRDRRLGDPADHAPSAADRRGDPRPCG